MQLDHKYLTSDGKLKREVYQDLKTLLTKSHQDDLEKIIHLVVQLSTSKNEYTQLLSFFIEIVSQYILCRDDRIISYIVDRIRIISLLPKRKLIELQEYQCMIIELFLLLFHLPKYKHVLITYTDDQRHANINNVEMLVHNYGSKEYSELATLEMEMGTTLKKMIRTLYNRMKHKDVENSMMVLYAILEYRRAVDRLSTDINKHLPITCTGDTVWYVWEVFLIYCKFMPHDVYDIVNKYSYLFSYQYNKKLRTIRIDIIYHICNLLCKKHPRCKDEFKSIDFKIIEEKARSVEIVKLFNDIVGHSKPTIVTNSVPVQKDKKTFDYLKLYTCTESDGE